MWAAAEGHLDVVKTLIAAGADVNLHAHITTYGTQPLGSPYGRHYGPDVRRS